MMSHNLDMCLSYFLFYFICLFFFFLPLLFVGVWFSLEFCVELTIPGHLIILFKHEGVVQSH